MTKRTLILTPWYVPHKIITWQDAITLSYLDKVDVVVAYDEDVRSPSTSMKMPAVVRLKRKLSATKRGVKFSRINVYARDGFACAYCRTKMPVNKLTYDHVVPRAQGGRTHWENIVTACYDCNARKGNRTPKQAGMHPTQMPYRPKSLPITPPIFDTRKIPVEWHDFCQNLPHYASA